ncbi:hypothetical protein ABZ642_38310 [Streptomyces sp. NPDC007157]|uniref:hypothetical protein n=1 Tax=Streptomyces sp. NPDC007157 TaxID=3154681 RepID=UPI0033FFC6D5
MVKGGSREPLRSTTTASNGTYGRDLTLGDIRATVDGGKGELTADVTSLGTTTKDVELADPWADSVVLHACDDPAAAAVLQCRSD